MGKEKNELLIRKDNREKYAIIEGEVYILKRQDEYNKRDQEAEKVARTLQKLIHGEDAQNILDAKEITYKRKDTETRYLAMQDVAARSLWNYKKSDGALSKKSNSILLKEFLVDHLMCNYVSDNDAFLLDTDEVIYATNKENAFRAIDDFLGDDGNVYTAMSYYYFDGEKGNNVYRKVFENYITSDNEKNIFSEKDFEEFTSTATKISNMNQYEYLGLFSELLKDYSDQEKEKITKVLLARKKALAIDAKNFVERLQKARKMQKEPEQFESPEKIAFINDIHGNLEALKSILEDCKKQGKTDVFILGDMIGFGPQSNECIDLIRKNADTLKIRCILGNHELYSLMGNKNFKSTAGFQSDLTSQIRKGMSVENREFIEGLPIERKIKIGDDEVTLSHYPITENYINDANMYLSHGTHISTSSTGLTGKYLIYGHEHRTEATKGDEVGTIGRFKNKDTEYINLPSSGCVHGKKTTYVTLQETKKGLEPNLVVIDYNQEKTKEALEKTGNPNQHFFSNCGR